MEYGIDSLKLRVFFCCTVYDDWQMVDLCPVLKSESYFHSGYNNLHADYVMNGIYEGCPFCTNWIQVRGTKQMTFTDGMEILTTSQILKTVNKFVSATADVLLLTGFRARLEACVGRRRRSPPHLILNVDMLLTMCWTEMLLVSLFFCCTSFMAVA